MAISGRQLRFRRKYPIIRPSTARFPRRFAPRNDKPEGPAPLNQWRKYCCSPRRSGNTATFFSRAAVSPPRIFQFAVLHIIENYGIFSVKILTKKLRGDMLDLSGKEGSPRKERPCCYILIPRMLDLKLWDRTCLLMYVERESAVSGQLKRNCQLTVRTWTTVQAVHAVVRGHSLLSFLGQAKIRLHYQRWHSRSNYLHRRKQKSLSCHPRAVLLCSRP